MKNPIDEQADLSKIDLIRCQIDIKTEIPMENKMLI